MLRTDQLKVALNYLFLYAPRQKGKSAYQDSAMAANRNLNEFCAKFVIEMDVLVQEFIALRAFTLQS